MGSSGGGGTPRQPDMPIPQGGMQIPYGQASPAMQPQMSYLPTDPNAVATGLTPEMLAAINAPPPPPPVMQSQAQSPLQNNPQEMRQLLATMMADRDRDQERAGRGRKWMGG